jgi:hypothetical protein
MKIFGSGGGVWIRALQRRTNRPTTMPYKQLDNEHIIIFWAI